MRKTIKFSAILVILLIAAGCGTDPEAMPGVAPRATITTTAPTVTDDINLGYPLDSVWVDTTKALSYELIDNTPGAAVWKQLWSFYVIGDTGPAGGIVFYITGNGSHGLEAATADQAFPISPGAPWGCSGTPIAGADGTAIGTGAQNTADIITGCNETGFAADLANDYSINGYTDWFLPSRDELHLMYLNIGQGSTTIGNVGGFAIYYYWSSSESGNGSDAWYQGFHNNILSVGVGKNDPFGVRAIRAF